jgi:hypothetical protein
VLEAEIDGSEAFADVDPDQPTVPAIVSGRVEGAAPRVVIAVNGTVAAVLHTYDDDGGPGRFAALIDPQLLVAGQNSVEVRTADP